MNRRGFIGALAGAFGLAAVDPEALLWAPSKKLISIPAPRFYLSINDFGERTLGPAAEALANQLDLRMAMRFVGREGQAYRPTLVYGCMIG